MNIIKVRITSTASKEVARGGVTMYPGTSVEVYVPNYLLYEIDAHPELAIEVLESAGPPETVRALSYKFAFRPVDTYEDLKEIVTNGVPQTRLVAGRLEPGDGNGSIFHFYPGDLTAANGFDVLADNANTGRWKSLNLVPGAAPLAHDHDHRYFTESESDLRYAALVHIHDDRYYTETESDARFPTKTDADAKYEQFANKGVAGGYVPLGPDGKIPNGFQGALALTDISTVDSEAAQLALPNQQEGDVAIRSDLRKSFAHNGGTAGTMADWNELLTPTDTVLSIDGRTGTVTLTDLYVAKSHLTDSDPHTQYQKESEKDVAGGYAALNASGFVIASRLGSGTRDGTKFLRDDGTWQNVGATGHTILDKSVAMTQRGGLNFAGEGFSASDDSLNNMTTISIPASSHRKNIVELAADVTNNHATANTLIAINDLSFNVIADEIYRYLAIIHYRSAVDTTGSRWTMNGPTFVRCVYTARWTTGNDTMHTSLTGGSWDGTGTPSASSLRNNNIAIIEGFVIPSANGTVVVRFASEVASSSIVASAGSTLEWW